MDNQCGASLTCLPGKKGMCRQVNRSNIFASLLSSRQAMQNSPTLLPSSQQMFYFFFAANERSEALLGTRYTL